MRVLLDLIILIRVKVYLDGILTCRLCLETLTYINIITRPTIDKIMANLLDEKTFMKIRYLVYDRNTTTLILQFMSHCDFFFKRAKS